MFCLFEITLDWRKFPKIYKKNHQSLIVLERSNHEWSFLPDEFYLQYIKTFFPLFNKVTSYMNTCATAIVGMWVERPNVCRTESASTCQSLFGTELVKNENNQNAQVNQLILYRIVTRRLKIICYTTKNADITVRTINFLFLLNHDPNSSYQS